MFYSFAVMTLETATFSLHYCLELFSYIGQKFQVLKLKLHNF